MLALAISILAGLAIASPLVSRAWPRRGGAALGLGVAASGAVLAVHATGAGAESTSVEWLPGVGASLALRLDGLALLFALLVTGVGALVVVYAWRYLEHEPLRPRAIAILMAFAASMLGLVLADDVVLLYVFWELTSITSWLLVGFHGDRPAARLASWHALIVTSAGGLALLAGLLLLSIVAGTSQISGIAAVAPAIVEDPRTAWAAGLVVAGIVTKSAQFPVHGWLPRAMEAPTPVSAYLHAATMVKAGVYLALRLAPVLGTVAVFRYGLLVAGGASLLVGATRAIFESDLKRVLAYSTISALGLLLLLTAVGTPAAIHAALAYTLAHAAYKGALFLVAGAVDHGAGTRDGDRLGGLWRAQPFTAAAAGLAALSMAGVPGGMGYVAKEATYGALTNAAGGGALLAMAVAGSALFVVAAAASGWRPFLSRRTSPPPGAHEVPVALWLPPLVLALFGIALGVAPAVADGLAAPAAAALVRSEVEPLALFHGWGTAALSIATLALGAVLTWQRPRIREAFGSAVAGASRDGFRSFLRALDMMAKRHTAALQNGSLRRYLLVTFGVAGLAVIAGFARAGGVVGLRLGSPRAAELAIGAVAIVAAIAAVRARSRVAAITALGAVGYSVGLTFLLFGAPDLAMTQIAVETVTVMVFLLAFRHLPSLARLSSDAARARDVTIAAAVGVVMALLVVAASAVQDGDPISSYLVARSVPDAHGHNVVNTILVDFRGLDTLGEATVLAVAGAGVVALLKLRPRRADA